MRPDIYTRYTFTRSLEIHQEWYRLRPDSSKWMGRRSTKWYSPCCDHRWAHRGHCGWIFSASAIDRRRSEPSFLSWKWYCSRFIEGSLHPSASATGKIVSHRKIFRTARASSLSMRAEVLSTLALTVWRSLQTRSRKLHPLNVCFLTTNNCGSY